MGCGDNRNHCGNRPPMPPMEKGYAQFISNGEFYQSGSNLQLITDFQGGFPYIGLPNGDEALYLPTGYVYKVSYNLQANLNNVGDYVEVAPYQGNTLINYAVQFDDAVGNPAELATVAGSFMIAEDGTVSNTINFQILTNAITAISVTGYIMVETVASLYKSPNVCER